MANKPLSQPLAIYVHWPFCLSKCPYCDFNSHVRDKIDIERWRYGLVTELQYYAEQTKDRIVSSVFFGGGTPSLMPPDLVENIIYTVDEHWGLSPDCEITLEANPTSSEVSNFKALTRSGVNRLSIGVQALNTRDLNFLGREHSEKEALIAVEAAQKTIARVSLDLIYGRPGQTLPNWMLELNRALSTGVKHISLYQLTIEKGTPFFAAHRDGNFFLPDEELAAALYLATNELCEQKGLPAYEISNHAQPGEESRHNLVYWKSGDYVGVGPGAHGRLTLGGQYFATEQISGPENWLKAVNSQGHGTRSKRIIPVREKIEEVLMMGLRLTGGISRMDFLSASGQNLEATLSEISLAPLIKRGFLEFDQVGLRTTPSGRLRLNAILGTLLT
ncbi:MAG: radical SAM family heme chaperone HemW [Rhodospirillaceae bacterium]